MKCVLKLFFGLNCPVQYNVLCVSSVMNSDRQRKRKLSGSSSPDLWTPAHGVSVKLVVVVVVFFPTPETKLTFLIEVQVNCCLNFADNKRVKCLSVRNDALLTDPHDEKRGLYAFSNKTAF